MARKKNDTQINRRTVLKNLGVAGVLAAGFAGTSAAKSTPDRKVVIKGDLDTPISFDAISTAAMDLGNEYDRDMAIPRPLDYGDAEIVAFLMYIKDNGVPSYYVGAVPKKAEQAGTTNQVSLSRSPSVAARHAELDRRLAELQERSSKKLSRISTNNTASTNASAGGFLPDSEWRKYSDGTVEIGACPYGRYNHTVDVWGYQDTYATGSKVAIFPGVNECGSKGMNNIQTIRHLWSEGDFEDSPTVQDFQPSGGVDGQITGTSLTVGYGTVGVGFSYQQPPVERDNNGTSTDAKWYYDWQRQHSDSTVLRTASIVSHNTNLEPYGSFLDTHTEHEFYLEGIPDIPRRFKNTESWVMN